MPSGKKSRLWYANPKIFQELTVGQIAEKFGVSTYTVRNIKNFHKDKKKVEVIPKEENWNGQEAQVRLRPFGVEMKEIDIILTELRRLLIKVKVWGGTDELQVKIQGLFGRANSLIKEIDDLDEMERVRKNTYEVASLASKILFENDIRFLKSLESLVEFLSLLGIGTNEKKN